MQKNKQSKQNQRNAMQHQRCCTEKSEDELSINAINLLIENKVDNGVKELKKKFWPYTLILLACGGVGIWGLFKGVTKDIKERLTSAYVAETLNEHIARFTDDKVANVADSRISIAEKRIIGGFEKKVAEQKDMLAKSSAAAETQIKSLQSALDVMKKAYDARGGSRSAFDEISLLATNKTEAGEIASKVIREIESSYSERKNREHVGLFGHVRHNVTYNGKNGKRGPISFADATMLIISNNHNFEEGAINRLADSGQKEFVEILMQAVLETPSLDSVYVALRSVEKLSGASFPVLGINEAKEWWMANKDKPEYNSPYMTVWTILLYDQMRKLPNESDIDYYKRVVIPLHGAVLAKPDLEAVAKTALPPAFYFGLDLVGKIEGVDCLKITKDLISHLGNDPVSRRMAFCYTAKTMALYEKISGEPLFNFIIRSIKAHPDFLEEFKKEKDFLPEYKELVETTIKTINEHTKGITFYCALSELKNGDKQLTSTIYDGNESLHNLDLVIKKNLTFVVHSSNDLEIPTGEVRGIKFKTDRSEGYILLLNDNGNPIIFDVQTNNKRPDEGMIAPTTPQQPLRP